MKKICFIIITVVIILALCSCGNLGLGVGSYTFDKIHIDTHHFSGCYTIEKWYENERGIEVKTKEVGSIFVSEGAYILVGDKCPICNAEVMAK